MSEVTTPDLQILLRARELVAAGWTQGESARDAGGKKISPFSYKAVCFCALGATHRAEEELGATTAIWDSAIRKLHPFTEKWNVAGWNDTPGRTQADVLAAFDAAIAEARRAG